MQTTASTGCRDFRLVLLELRFSCVVLVSCIRWSKARHILQDRKSVPNYPVLPKVAPPYFGSFHSSLRPDQKFQRGTKFIANVGPGGPKFLPDQIFVTDLFPRERVESVYTWVLLTQRVCLACIINNVWTARH